MGKRKARQGTEGLHATLLEILSWVLSGMHLVSSCWRQMNWFQFLMSQAPQAHIQHSMPSRDALDETHGLMVPTVNILLQIVTLGLQTPSSLEYCWSILL
jgi:hypothetical protein